jgi:CBS domain-containing protein
MALKLRGHWSRLLIGIVSDRDIAQRLAEAAPVPARLVDSDMVVHTVDGWPIAEPAGRP